MHLLKPHAIHILKRLYYAKQEITSLKRKEVMLKNGYQRYIYRIDQAFLGLQRKMDK